MNDQNAVVGVNSERPLLLTKGDVYMFIGIFGFMMLALLAMLVSAYFAEKKEGNENEDS